MLTRNNLAKWHIWLGWIIGVPLLFWTSSGLFMVSQPIEKIRGEHLKSKPLALSNSVPIAPRLDGRAIISLTLLQQPDGPQWVITYADGDQQRANGLTGAILPPLSAIEAEAIARGHFAGDAILTGVTRFSADTPPLDLRRARPSWQATFSDQTRVYIDADTGAILATRSQLWRIFDVMWGLHIMDLQDREDSSHPILIIFAALAFLATLLGLILLPLRQLKARRAIHQKP